MAHSFTPAPAPATPISTSSMKQIHFPSLGFRRVWACHQRCDADLDHQLVRRRSIFIQYAGSYFIRGRVCKMYELNIGNLAHCRAVTLGLAGAVLGFNVGDQSASAAARRPPPPSPEEKRDPNVSGVQAKVLASKRRKEAMKESMAKLRERGKPVDGSRE
ncbi:hypothetical protein CJ030_MR5G000478 [Morella rubra]|uniref:Uncharacterized protein n=1 Tax=Morella rubra TaxID=262757 RepID=A0A6A1VNT9_9ROSI|nr:hypothetical protein CJ030_MR5G000478 [Morella rubra]